MPKLSAGIVLHRGSGVEREVLLLHPGGPLWAKRDAGAWSIPKGLIEPGEDALMAARREFAEETGGMANGPALDLGRFRQPGGKIVIAFAVAGDFDPGALRSTTFALEWPPRSGRTLRFPEADRAAWFDLTRARAKILKGQAAILDALAARLGASG